MGISKNRLWISSRGSLYFEPKTVKSDAVKNVMTFKVKPFFVDGDGQHLLKNR